MRPTGPVISRSGGIERNALPAPKITDPLDRNASMKFTSTEIELARRLKQLGLAWTPAVGHYVWDEAGLIDCPSPFHDHVYFILDLKHFLRRSGTIERLQRDLCWLPTWEQARDLLRDAGFSDAEFSHRLAGSGALENGSERVFLYELLAGQLTVTAACRSSRMTASAL